MTKVKISLVCLSIFLSGSLFADQEKKGKRKPPKEALTACEGQVSGDACTFEGRHGAATGTCFTPSEDRPLACKPEKGKRKKKKEKKSST